MVGESVKTKPPFFALLSAAVQKLLKKAFERMHGLRKYDRRLWGPRVIYRADLAPVESCDRH